MLEGGKAPSPSHRFRPLQGREGICSLAGKWMVYSTKREGGKKPTNPATNAPKALGKRIYILRNRASVPLQLTFPSHTLLPPARRCQSVPKNPAAPMQPAPKRRVPNPQPASAPPNQAGGTWCCPLVLGEEMLVRETPPPARYRGLLNHVCPFPLFWSRVLRNFIPPKKKRREENRNNLV